MKKKFHFTIRVKANEGRTLRKISDVLSAYKIDAMTKPIIQTPDTVAFTDGVYDLRAGEIAFEVHDNDNKVFEALCKELNDCKGVKLATAKC